MNTLLRNKRPLYLCKKYVDSDTGVTKFEKPDEKLYLNWQPISSDGETYVFGVEYSKYIRIKGNKDECLNFHNKDRVYVYKEIDLVRFNGMCDDADYEVDGSPIITLNYGEVLLKRLSSGDDDEN